MPNTDDEIKVVQRVVSDISVIGEVIVAATSNQLVKIMAFHTTNKTAVVGMSFPENIIEQIEVKILISKQLKKASKFLPFKFQFSQFAEGINNNCKENMTQNSQNLHNEKVEKCINKKQKIKQKWSLTMK